MNIAALTAQEVNKQKRILFSSDYLKNYSECINEIFDFGLITDSNGNLMPYQVLQILPEHFNQFQKLSAKKDTWLQTFFLNCSEMMKRKMKIILVGNIQITGSDGLCSGDDKPDLKHVYRVLKEKYPDYDAIIIKDIAPEYVSNSQGSVAIPMLPLMQLNIREEWKSFNDYIGALSSKYRVRVKAARSRMEPLKPKLLNADETANLSKDLNQLYMNVYEKAKFKIAWFDDDFLVKLKQKYANELVIQAYFLDEKPIGFIAVLNDSGIAHAIMIGLDYQFNEAYKLYFNLLIDSISIAINQGANKLNMGRTAMEIKSTLGAEPVETYSIAKFRKLSVKLAMKRVISTFRQPEWEQRKPFRETKDTSVDKRKERFLQT